MPDAPLDRDDSVERDAVESELRASVAAIQEGLADAAAGRMQPLEVAFAELRKELGIPEHSDEASGGRQPPEGV